MLLLKVLDGVDDDGVDVLLVVWVLAVAALLEPLHDVEAGGHGKRQLVAIEEIDNQSGVAVGGELVGEELAVLPDTKDVGNEEDAGVLVSLVGGSLSQVALILAADGDLLALRGTPLHGDILLATSGPRCW